MAAPQRHHPARAGRVHGRQECGATRVHTVGGVQRAAALRAGDVHPVLDLKKAYDVIHHDTLFSLLSHMGVPDATVNLLRAWAKVRTTRLVINGEASDPIPIEVGVPQGAISSPILFNLFIRSQLWFDVPLAIRL